MHSKTDYAISVLIGFFIGVFAIPVLLNIGRAQGIDLSSLRIAGILLPLVSAFLIFFGVWASFFLSRWISFFVQLGKFSAVGFLNSAIDFGTLNFLSLVTGVTSGFIIGGVNVPGFLIAATNSYFWNKFWVFKKIDEKGWLHDLPLFALITIVGLLLNSGLVIFSTTFLSAPFGINPSTWLNISKVLATVITLVWNFLGYKFLVFRTEKHISR